MVVAIDCPPAFVPGAHNYFLDNGRGDVDDRRAGH